MSLGRTHRARRAARDIMTKAVGNRTSLYYIQNLDTSYSSRQLIHITSASLLARGTHPAILRTSTWIQRVMVKRQRYVTQDDLTTTDVVT
jgi:hypothetical protein